MTAQPASARTEFLDRARSSPTFAASGLKQVHETLESEIPISEMRRRRLRRRPEPGVGYLSLVENDIGVLRWDVDAGPAPRPSDGARGRRRGLTTLGLLEQYKFNVVQGSQVAAFLDALDTGFNPVRGLRTQDANGADTGPAVATNKGRILLIVHGTFSKGAALLDGLTSTKAGQALLKDAWTRYDQVLSFEHPTLSVSPILNALDLARAFASSNADIDIVCHSRGGLVVRWWLEALNAGATAARRVVFVGSPLQGTSLASPRRLRDALNLMTNVIVAMAAAGELVSLAVPLFGVIAGLMKLLSSVTGAVVGAPVIDVAVGLIPGLSAQCRRGLAGNEIMQGNFELDRLSMGPAAAPEGYFVVKGNFEPAEARWAFWKYFMQPGERLSDFAADRVFPGQNDLVVDTESMDALTDVLRVSAPTSVLDFGTTATVHHLNYFAQEETAMFIRKALAL